MAEPTQFVFSHKELTEMLIKNQGLHDGIWTVGFQLGMGNTHVPSPSGGETVPAVIVSILGVALQKVEKDAPNALDAAHVNPKK
jgi:hypothetical protein